MFTKGLPHGKRPIYCGYLPITCVYFLPDSEKISQTTIGAWTDTSRVFWTISKCLNQVKKENRLCKWQSDAADDAKEQTPHRLSFYLDTTRPISHHSLSTKKWGVDWHPKNQSSVKGTGPRRFGFLFYFYFFMCDYYVALISALVLLKSGNLSITVVV